MVFPDLQRMRLTIRVYGRPIGAGTIQGREVSPFHKSNTSGVTANDL